VGGGETGARLRRRAGAAGLADQRSAAGRSLGHARLVEALAQPGCPVCRCVRDDSLRHLGTMLYEHVTDPGVRAALRASRGFCSWHAALLTEVPDSAFGASIIAGDILGSEIARVERLLAARDGRVPPPGRLRRFLPRARGKPARAAAPRRAPCPACEAARDAERRHLAALVELADDRRLEPAFDGSDGLCLPHAGQLVDGRADRAAAARLLARTLARWRSVLADLRGFTDKHDHRRRQPFTEAEARSWRLALELLAGAPGVFASDLAAGRGAGAEPPR